MEGTRRCPFIKIKKGTQLQLSSFICSPRVLDCYRLCAPPTFSYLEIEHPVVDCLRYEWNLPLSRPTLVPGKGLKPPTGGVEIRCSIQLSYPGKCL